MRAQTFNLFRKLSTRLMPALLITLLAMTTLPVTPAFAAAITVNSTADALNNADGVCTLREAIINANNDAATWANCAAGSGADIISLPAGTYTLTLAGAGENAAATGDLDIADNAGVAIDLTITGAESSITFITGDIPWADRIFDMQGNAGLNISGMTLSRGSVAGNGGGINKPGTGTLDLADLVFYNDTASDRKSVV